MEFKDYLAAVERLKRYESDGHVTDVYPEHGQNGCPLYDKATVYDAEHNPAPVDAEWLREIGLEALDEGMFSKGMLQVLIDSDCTFGLTRGDVLTSLRLFAKGGAK